MKSKNPKFIKKGLCILIAMIVIITATNFVVNGYKKGKVAMAKEEGQENLTTISISELKNKAGNSGTDSSNGGNYNKYSQIYLNTNVKFKSEPNIKVAALAKKNSSGDYVAYEGPEGKYKMVLGDVTGDEIINHRDASKVWQYLAGNEYLTVAEKLAADINGDGLINENDIYIMLYGSVADGKGYIIGNPYGGKVDFENGTISADTLVEAADARSVLRSSLELDEDTIYKTLLRNLLSDYNMDFKNTKADARLFLNSSTRLPVIITTDETEESSADNWNENQNGFTESEILQLEADLGLNLQGEEVKASDIIDMYLAKQLAEYNRYKDITYNDLNKSTTEDLLPELTEEGTYRLSIYKMKNNASALSMSDTKFGDYIGIEANGWSNYYDVSYYYITIDKTAPICTEINYQEETGGILAKLKFNEDVKLSADDEFGTEKEITFIQNETKSLTYYDKAGNSITVPVTVNSIDDKLPMVASIRYSESEQTNNDVNVEVTFSEEVFYTWSSEETVADLAGLVERIATHHATKIEETFSENGTYYLNYSDGVNFGVIPIIVTNIDKEPPTYVNSYSRIIASSRKVAVGITFSEPIDNSYEGIKIYAKIGNTWLKNDSGSTELLPTDITGGTVYGSYEIPVNLSGNVSVIITGKVKDKAGNLSGNIQEQLDNVGTVNQTGIVSGESAYTVKINGNIIDYTKSEHRVKKGGTVSIVDLSDKTEVIVTCTESNNEKLTTLGGIDVSSLNIYLDGKAPTMSNIEIYADPSLEYARYKAGRKIVFKLTADEKLDETKTATIHPTIKVAFSASGTAKGNEGLATYDYVSGKDIYYTYTIEEGDEGTLLYGYKGTLVDVAGNQGTIEDTTNELETSSNNKLPRNIAAVTSLDKGLTVKYNITQNNNKITVKATFNKNIWKRIGEIIDAYEGVVDEREEFDSGRAPILIMADGLKKGDKYIKFTAGNPVQNGSKTEITYTYNIDDSVNIIPQYIVLGYEQEDHIYFLNYDGLTYANANTFEDINADNYEDYTVNILNYIQPVSGIELYNENNSQGDIYADTTEPRVIIEASEISPSNASKITYTFKFTEKIKDFTADKITVNNGTKGEFKEVPGKDGLEYTLEVTPNVKVGSQETVQVIVEDGACVDLTNKNVVRAESNIVVDRIKPELRDLSAVLSNDKQKIIVTAIYSEELSKASDSNITVTVGGKSASGTLGKKTISKNKVTYIYNISAADSGKVNISLSGNVTDAVGNISDPISSDLATNITLTSSAKRLSDGKDYTFTKSSTDLTNNNVIYLKEGDTLTVKNVTDNKTYTGTVDANTPEGKITGLTPDGNDELTFSTSSGTITIPSGYIVVDKTAPEYETVDVQAVNPVTNGLYTEGSEFTIKVTTSEEVSSSTKEPSVNVYFRPDDKELGNAGKFNDGKAEYVSKVKNSSGTTTYTYRYVASEGDIGTLKYRVVGTLTDLAGNSKTYANAASTNPATEVSAIKVDAIHPTVAIAVDKNLVRNTTNADKISFVFTWSEPVTGFTAEDIILSNTLVESYKEVTTGEGEDAVTENVLEFEEIEAGKKYKLTVDTVATNGIAIVKIPQNACQDAVGQENIENELYFTIDKVKPVLQNATAKLSNDGKKITVEAIFDKDLNIPENYSETSLKTIIKIGNRTIDSRDEIVQTRNGKKATFVYDGITQADYGDVKITLTGYVRDYLGAAGNLSDKINETVENNIKIVKKGIAVGEDTYTFAINGQSPITDLSIARYLKAGDTLTIIKNETERLSYTIGRNDKYGNNTKLLSANWDVNNLFLTDETGSIDISSANIYFDTQLPTIDIETSVDRVFESGRYPVGTVINISLTTESMDSIVAVPEVNVAFSEKGNGQATYVGRTDKNNKTTWNYTYTVSNIDEGELIITCNGNLKDLAGNTNSLEASIPTINERTEANLENIVIGKDSQGKDITVSYKILKNNAIVDPSKVTTFTNEDKIRVEATYSRPILSEVGQESNKFNASLYIEPFKLTIGDGQGNEIELDCVGTNKTQEISQEEQLQPITVYYEYDFSSNLNKLVNGDYTLDEISLNEIKLSNENNSQSAEYFTAYVDEEENPKYVDEVGNGIWLGSGNADHNKPYRSTINNTTTDITGLRLIIGNDVYTNEDIYADNTKPTVAIISENNITRIENTNKVKYTFTWSEKVTDFTVEDIEVSNGRIVENTFTSVEEGKVYTVEIEPTVTEGELQVKVEADVCKDLVGLGNVRRESEVITVTKPVAKVTITAKTSNGDDITKGITNDSKITYTFTWDKEVEGFDVSDVKVPYDLDKSSFKQSESNRKVYTMTMDYGSIASTGHEETVKVSVKVNCIGDELINEETEKEIRIDKIRPEFKNLTVSKSDDETKIIVISTFSETIDVDKLDELNIAMKVGTEDVELSEPIVADTKVTYTYDVLKTDNGIVVVSLNGNVYDIAGNKSDSIEANAGGDIELVSTIGTKYTYKKNNETINNFIEPTYLKAGDTLTIVKTTTVEENGELKTTQTTYVGTVTEDTKNGQLKKITLTDPEDGEENGVITFSGSFDISGANIIVDTIAPKITTTMTAVNPVTSGRYTAGDEFTIRVTPSEDIKTVEDDEIPVIGVNFGKDAGKFNNGEAQFVSKSQNENTVFTYRYVAAVGDEGKPILELKSGSISDLAGNTTELVRNSEINVEVNSNNKYGVTKIEFLDNHGNVLKENAILPGNLSVKVYFRDGLYSAVNTPANVETAPSLYLNDIKGETLDVNMTSKYITYKFEDISLNNVSEIEKIELKNENTEILYAGRDNISSATEIRGEGLWNINIDNSQNELIIKNIYIDTTAPTVQIIPEADPTNAHIDENKNEVAYRVIWSEKVSGFDETAIKVNYGEIIKDSFVEVEGSEGLEYTFKAKPNITVGNTGHLQVIVEQDRCIDEVGLRNIRTESNITVDKIVPQLQATTSTLSEDGKQIIVTATFSEEIGDVNTSNISVKVGGVNGNGSLEEPEINGNTIKYIYNISSIDNGNVEITLKGTVKDVAGNPSSQLSVKVENDIKLEANVIEIDGVKYTFTKNNSEELNNFGVPTYFKAGDKITVTKIEEGEDPVVYEYIVENKYADNTKITKMALTAPAEGDEVGTVSFGTGLDISAANIYFDTTIPTLVETVVSTENEKTVYTVGEEIKIQLTSSEELKTSSIAPKLAIRFNETLGNYNAGEAKLINTKVTEGKTVWTYTYKVASGDNGELSTQFTAGKLVDFAGNEITLTNLNLPTIRDGSTNLVKTIDSTKEITVTYDIYKNNSKLTSFDTVTEFKPSDEIIVVAKINKKVYESYGSTNKELTKEKAPILKLNNIDMVCDSVSVTNYETAITYKYTVTDAIEPTQIESLKLVRGEAQYYTDAEHLVTDINSTNVSEVRLGAGTTSTDIKGLKLVFNKYDKVTVEEGIFADTIAPEVTISAKDKTGNVISNLYTNSDEITYELTWSEEVSDFTADDITVNQGIKGTLSAPVANDNGTYTYTLKVTGIREGTVQIIVEADKVKDKANLTNPRQEMKINVDSTAPIYISLDAYAESTDGLKLNSEIDTVRERYRLGDIITVTATFNENISADNIPELNLQFSESGNAKGQVSQGIINGNKITYTYTITAGDEGEVSVKGYNGEVKDLAGNVTRVTKKALDGDKIIADTKLPEVKAINVTSPGEGVYKAGRVITIEVQFTEEVYNIIESTLEEETNAVTTRTISNLVVENMPTLKLKVGNVEKEATKIGYGRTEGQVDKTKLVYTYTIVDGDNGAITVNTNKSEFANQVKSKLCDIAGNSASNKQANIVDPKIKADTIRPTVTGIAATVVNPSVLNTRPYYKAGNLVKITVNFNEEVSSAVLMPQILVGFSETEDVEPETYNNLAYESNWNVNSTVMEYTYTIQDGDNGYLWVKVPENQFADEAGNGNVKYKLEGDNLVGQRVTNVYADTIRPYLATNTNGTSQWIGVTNADNTQVTVTGIFSEEMFIMNSDNSLSRLDSSNAPKLGIFVGGELQKTNTNAPTIEIVDGKTKLTYTINVTDIDTKATVSYNLVKATLYDRAGNVFSIDLNGSDFASPEFNSIQVITEEGYYKKDDVIEIAVKFNEATKLENLPKLKIAIGDTVKELTGTYNANDALNTGIIKVARYEYTITNENGPVSIISIIGNASDGARGKEINRTYIDITPNDNVNDINANADEEVYDSTGISVYKNALEEAYDNYQKVVADTINPYITEIVARENNKTTTIYKNEDGQVITNVIRTNDNIVRYEITYSEPVKIFDENKIYITNGIIKDIKPLEPFGKKGHYNKFIVTVQTTTEGVQSLTINDETVKDRAGNTDKYENGLLRLNAVTTDFTMPTVRFISEYNGGNYVLPTTVSKVELRPNVEISEDISYIAYKWDDGEYEEIEDYSASSDIAIPSKVATEAGIHKLYIKVTDLAGNTSESEKSYKVLASTINLVPDNTNYTNEDLTLTVTFGEGLTDNRKVMFKSDKTGETRILDASGVEGDGTTYTIIENGLVYAEATDKVGNKVFNTLEISNIDKEKPEIELSINGGNLVIGTNKTYATIKTIVTTKDIGVSGISNVKYAYSTEDITELSEEFVSNMENTTITEFETIINDAVEGTYYLYVIASDKAGNNKVFKSNAFVVVNSNILTDDDGNVTYTPTAENVIKLGKDAKIIYVDFGVNLPNDRDITFTNDEDGIAYVEESYAEIFKPTTITAKAKDICGNEVIATLTVEHVDGPDFEVIGNPEDWTNQNVVLEVVCYEELSALTVNGADILENRKATIAENGDYTFVATDKYGNSTTEVITVSKIDKVSPTIGNIEVDNQTIIIEATDELSGVSEYAITDTTEVPVEWSSSASIKTTKDGIFYIWAKDYAGNIIRYSDSIMVDSTAPDIQEVKADGRRIIINAADNISGISGYALTTSNSNPADENWETSRIINLNEDGIFYVWVKDNNNNIAKADDTIIVDITKPVISNISMNGQEITIKATDATSGISGYAITDTTEVPAEWSNSNKINTTKDGIFYAWAKDKAGNTIMYSSPIVIDTTAPEITFEFSSLKEIIGKQIGAVIKTNEDALISYRWNEDEDWVTTDEYANDVKAVKLPRAEGDYTLFAKAIDRYSNESRVQKLEFKVTKKEEVQIAEIEFEDLTTVQVDGVKYVKVSPTMSAVDVTSYMNVGKLAGATPEYTNLTKGGKLKTGSEIKIDGALQYIVIVKGDVNCDGEVTPIDVTMANSIRFKRINYSTIQFLAADANSNGQMNPIDITLISRYRLGQISI